MHMVMEKFASSFQHSLARICFSVFANHEKKRRANHDCRAAPIGDAKGGRRPVMWDLKRRVYGAARPLA
jgi:hypothetical protein